MEIDTSLNDGIAILRLSGRLTVSDKAGNLKQAASHAVAAGASVVLLDLARVPYIDSTRLGELIAAHITVARQGGRLGLVGTTSRITELLTLAGLEGIFELFPTVADARASFGV